MRRILHLWRDLIARSRRALARLGRHRWIRNGWVGGAVLGAVGGVAAVVIFGSVHRSVGPLDVTFRLQPALSGRTDVDLAPLGALRLDTHDGPARLRIDIDRIRLPQAQALLADEQAVDRLPQEIEVQTREAVIALVRKAFLAAALGGAAVSIVRRPHWKHAIAGSGAAVVLATTVAGYAASTWNAQALAEPRYTGLLTLAPQAVGDVKTATERFAQYRTEINALVDNVARLYQSSSSVESNAGVASTIRILHVSDMHLNPAGFDLTKQMVEQFRPSMIIDSGDINDWGTTFESTFVERIGTLSVPYVYVRGNHDSIETQDAVATRPNAVVLDGMMADVQGVRIWGIGDPRFTADKSLYEDRAEEASVATAFALTTLQRLQTTGVGADIAVVHDPATAARLGGAVPLVLAGHLHQDSARQLSGGTTMLIEGSTGGAGLRGVRDDGASVPLECSMLYLDPTTHRLVAYDHITVDGLGGSGARIERHYANGTPVSTTTSTSDPTNGNPTTGDPTSTSAFEPAPRPASP